VGQTETRALRKDNVGCWWHILSWIWDTIGWGQIPGEVIPAGELSSQEDTAWPLHQASKQSSCCSSLWEWLILLSPHVLEMEEAERPLKHQHRVYCSGRSTVEGDCSKRTRAHCHTQAWARYRGLVENDQEGH
jgi:hypothetical protein